MGSEGDTQRAVQRVKGPGRSSSSTPDAQIDDGLSAEQQSAEVIHAIAEQGVADATGQLPHFDTIQGRSANTTFAT